MIETMLLTDALSGPAGFLAALLVGIGFGFVLEQAGFGSSRRIAGVFYFTDMTVIKVMFTGLVTATIGLLLCERLGLTGTENIHIPTTIYGAQAVGGIIFGVGFALSGWCPGTSAVGLASGRYDAGVFLGAAILGSILFNELFPIIEPLYNWGEAGVRYLNEALGISKASYTLIFTLMAVAVFMGVEKIDPTRTDESKPGAPALAVVSLALVVLAVGPAIIPASPDSPPADPTQAAEASAPSGEAGLIRAVARAEDHIDPQELADRLMAKEPGLVLIDTRTPAEYQTFHLKGAVNVTLEGLADYLEPTKNQGLVVLYSNGMVHPAQARDSLARQGHTNVYFLTDGLKGFFEECLKPVSLRLDPVSPDQTTRIKAWRAFFLAPLEPVRVAATAPQADLPGMIEPEWMVRNLSLPGLRIIDVRGQKEYNTGHIPGSVRLNADSLRGAVAGISSVLLPRPILAGHMSLMGIGPNDLVVLVTGDRIRDATLAAMALERLGHSRYAILNNGWAGWLAADGQVTNDLPKVTPAEYPVASGPDGFTVTYKEVLAATKDGRTVIIDTRPQAYYEGRKSNEARAGHIPGAVNRPYKEDLTKDGDRVVLKPLADLAKAYAAIIPGKDTPVIVHCRTGHQASQAWFVLKRLLGYRKVMWYDASWTEWSTMKELPIVSGK